ncbi:MAG: alpha/beta hydrolase [Pseudomonadota bacterium]
MADEKTDLEAIVARAYTAVTRPGVLVDLLHDLSEFEGSTGAFGESVELHFSNAAEILENVFPNDRLDHSNLNTQKTDRLSFDLAIDQQFRIAFANNAVFANDQIATDRELPAWLFEPASEADDRQRLVDLLKNGTALDENEGFGGFFRLHTSEQDEKGLWFTARLHHRDADTIIGFDAVRLRWSERSGEAFSQALRLTETEIALVRHLVTGGSLREFADKRGRSLGTARNQMKALQRKLSINSKEELLLLYAGFVHSLEMPAERLDVEEHRCDKHFRPNENECIAWEEHGDPGGIPILYFHPIEGALLTPEVANAARRFGLRIIAPWRPHHGETTADTQGMKAVAEFAERLPAFLEHLGVKRCSTLTTQAGAPYMFAFVQKHPDMVVSAIGAGSFLPIFDAQGMASYRPAHRRQVRLVRIAPTFAKIYQRAMLATIGTGEFHRFVEEFYRGCDRELAAIQKPAMVRMLRSAATYVVRGRFVGTAETMITWAADWSKYCRDITVPVHMIYGENDATISPIEAERASANFGFEPIEFVADAGSFLLQDQTDMIMARIHALSDQKSEA